MLGEIYVHVFREPNMHALSISIWREIENGFTVYSPKATTNGVQWTWKDYEHGMEPEPTFRLPGVFANKGVVQKLVDGIKEVTGIVPVGVELGPQEDLRDHLKDLQKIIFDFNWVELQRGTPARIIEEE